MVTQTQTQFASLNPETFSEGGGPPVDRNLLVNSARFEYFEYENREGQKGNKTFAIHLHLTDDDGNEFHQRYSIGSPDRWVPSQDGKKAQPVGHTSGISKSSNAGVFLTELVNAGFPANRLSDDISCLDGLYFLSHGVPEPKRQGLNRQEQSQQQQRERVILVPKAILRLPGEAASSVQAPPPPAPPVPPPSANPTVPQPPTPSQPATPPSPPAPSSNGDATGKALEMAMKVAGETNNTFTLQNVMVKVMQEMATDPNRDMVAGHLFTPEFATTLQQAGFTVSGHNVSKS